MNATESMDMEEAGVVIPVTEEGDIHLFSGQIDRLQQQATELASEIEGKTVSITQLNQSNFQLRKENDLLKCDLTNVRELNSTYELENQQLRQLLENYERGNGAIIGQMNSVDNDQSQLHSTLLDKLNLKTVELQMNKKENMLENIENLSKLNQSINDLTVLKEKNEHSQKFIESKDEYVSLLIKYNQKLKDNFATLQASYREEIDSQNELISTIQTENAQLRAANSQLESSFAISKSSVTNLSQKLVDLQEQFSTLEEEQAKTVSNFTEEKSSYLSEIEKLNDLLKRSKDEIVDQYIEKLYPHITGLCAMFDKNVSVSQLYSLYFEQKRSNEDMQLEKALLQERLTALDTELESVRESSQKYCEEIGRLRKLEEKIFTLENDNKEGAVALRFYQDMAQSLYKGSKAFNENFMALSEKIQRLAQQSNVSSEADSSGMLALQYIMELQSKFQDFSKLQAEFEKGKLDLLNEKRNLIDTDHELESLRSQVEHLESEKRISANKAEQLGQEYEVLQSLLKNSKATYESQIGGLQSVNSELQKKLAVLTENTEKLKLEMEKANQRAVHSEAERKDLETKLESANKQAEFSKQRIANQQNFLSQMEKSLGQLRAQNISLNEINQKLTENMSALQTKHAQAHTTVIQLESQLSVYRLQVRILSEKETALNRKLEEHLRDSILQSDLTTLIESLKASSTTMDSTLLKKIQAVEGEKANILALLEQKEVQWSNEKSLLTQRIGQLETLFSEEAAKLNALNENYAQLHALKTSAAVIDENAPVDEILKSENDLLRNQLENVNKQFAELSGQLNSISSKYSELSQENGRLLEVKGELEGRLNSVGGELSEKSLKLAQAESELTAKVTELERKFNQTAEKYSKQIEVSQAELAAKEGDCQVYAKQIEELNGTVSQLKGKLEQAAIEVNSAQEQIKIYQETCYQLRIKQNTETAKHTENATIIGDLRARVDQLQTRVTESEEKRIKREEEFTRKLSNSQSEYQSLQEEYSKLNGLYTSVSSLNRQLAAEVATIRQRLLDDPAYLAKREQLLELASLNGLIESLYTENKLLAGKVDTFTAKETRLKSEAESLRANVGMLEDCLKKEKENMDALKSFYSSSASKEEILVESANQVRAEKDRLEREVVQLKHRIGQLEEQLKSEDIAQMNKDLSENKAQIEVLNGQLSARVGEINALNQKLKAEDERNKKLEGDVQQITAKFDSASSQLDTLRKELASKGTLSAKQQTEVTSLKSSLAASDEAKGTLAKEIETLRKEISGLQSTNLQLKMLARKYKSQSDELQRTINANAAASAAAPSVNIQAEREKEAAAAEAARQITEKEAKISELEGKIRDSLAQFEATTGEIARLKKENEDLKTSSATIDEKAKRIAHMAGQRIQEFRRQIALKDEEIVALKTERQADFDVRQPSTSKSGLVNSTNSKMPISSTFISASLPSTSSSAFESTVSSNPQPSSSNEEVEEEEEEREEIGVTLQSAQITSHSTSDDNGSSQVFSSSSSTGVVNQIADSNVTSNKRGYASDGGVDPGEGTSGSGGKKARRDPQPEVSGEADVDDENSNSNQSEVINLDEESTDSNDVSATGSGAIMYASGAEQVETNGEESVESADGNAPVVSGNVEEQEEEEEEVEVEEGNAGDDDDELGHEAEGAEAAFEDPSTAASTSSSLQLPLSSSSSSVTSYQLPASFSTAAAAAAAFEAFLSQQQGTSSSSPSFSRHSMASTSLAFHPLAQHPLANQSAMSSTFSSSHAYSESLRSLPGSQPQQQQQPQPQFRPSAPRLMIPSHSNLSSTLLSPSNPLHTPMVPFSTSSSNDDGERIVPSTPILFAPSRFDESVISPQVPQSRFHFSGATAVGTATGSSTVSTAGADGTVVRERTAAVPSVAETVSSVISIDDTVAQFVDSNSPSGQLTSEEATVEEAGGEDGGGGGGVGGDSNEASTNEEESISASMPTSSDSTNSQEQAGTSGTLSSSSNSGPRPRKLRILRSSRGGRP